MKPGVKFHTLEPHPAARPDAIGHLHCGVIWQDVQSWAFDFYVGEPPEAVRMPQPQAPARSDDLWQTTCFEVFLQREGDEGYFEFNFSPSGLWAAYRFADYRQGREDLAIDSPLILNPDPDHTKAIILTASYDGTPFARGGPWRAGISAVIEETNGTKSYWALAHPSDKPDFHHPDSFVLELP